MMRQPSHRLAAEDGFTLTELLVATTISVVILLATLGALDAFNSGVAANNRLTDAADTARRQVATMVSGLREAGTVQQAGPNDILFLSTSWPGESGVGSTFNYTERYCLDTAARNVWFYGWKASGPVPAGPACGSPATGWTRTLVASNVLNTGDPNTGDPLFVYGFGWPSSPLSVRTVSINLRLQSGTALKPRTLVLRSGANLRGALAPQVGAGDITVGPCTGGRALLTLNLALPGANGAKMSASNSIPAGPGRILVPAPARVAVTITNLHGLQTPPPVTKNVSC
jgi:prepilin-type N-terminal cleavage/methylation domain-containing protein